MTFFTCGTPSGHLPPQGDQGGACGQKQGFFQQMIVCLLQNTTTSTLRSQNSEPERYHFSLEMSENHYGHKTLEYQKCLVLSKCEPSKKNLSLIVPNML